MFKEKLALIPNKPGCYLMKNKDNIIIYVGKAKNLKNRVISYFRGTKTGKTAKLVSEIYDFEYIIVGSETEALILELNLIKKHDPKYNILLRDDKSYPYIEFTNEQAPRLLVVRNINIKKNKDRLFGPYPNVIAARSTVNLLNRLYPLRKCRVMPKEVCLYYHIKQCLGYCVYKEKIKEIDNMEKDIIKFLKGDSSLVEKKLKEELEKASKKLNFEKAKELKDSIDYIKITLAKQKVEINSNIDTDIFGYYSDDDYLSITVFFVRGGKIVGNHYKIIPLLNEIEEDLTTYIINFYQKGIIIPDNVLVTDNVDIDLLNDFYNNKFVIPIKGSKKKIIDMAIINAKNNLENKIELIKKDEKRTIEANETLRKILKLNKLDIIEIFDNSNVFGSYNVSGMVVFKNGIPSKSDYRKFKISIDKNDDYNTMREVIYRRYLRILKDGLIKPDLIIVDGGIGQINIAREVINSLSLNIPVTGLKKNNKHKTESLYSFNNEEIPIDKRGDLFLYLERIQEEVHNFTINYHKQIRSKGAIMSSLDNIKGLGPKLKERLIKEYKTINNIKSSSDEQLLKIIPKNVLKILREKLTK